MTALRTRKAAPLHGRGMYLARSMYVPRIVGLLLGGVAVGATLQQHETSLWLWLLLFGNALVWPHAAYWRSRRAKEPRVTEQWNLAIDSLLGGFWVVAMQGCLIPSTLVLGMLAMNNISIGSTRFLSIGLLANAAGAALGLLLLGLNFEPAASLSTQLLCVPFLLAYPLCVGFVAFRLAKKLHAQREELKHLSERDAMTGLYNRRYFEDGLQREFFKFLRYQHDVCLVIADIDHFKQINDTFGHAAGDDAIRAFARVLTEHSRQGDLVARLGGDEFVALLVQTSPKDALLFAQRVQHAFVAIAEQQRAEDGDGPVLSASMGIAMPHPRMRDYHAWLELADTGLYRVKTTQRGTAQVATFDAKSGKKKPDAPKDPTHEPAPEDPTGPLR